MQRTLILIASTAVLLLGACGETKLPDPTGKGSVRAINAIPASPRVAFLIEERGLATANYKDGTSSSEYDDFLYDFNFEIVYPGDAQSTRIATQELQVVNGKDYVFVVGGTLDNANVTVWEGDERDWTGTETVFELRVGHTAASYGTVDVYVVPESMAPAPEYLEATLALGEVSTATDIAEGVYSITITATGDINDVLFQSAEISFGAQLASLLTLFDGDENDLGPMAVRVIQPSGTVIALADANTTPTIRFIHASLDLGNADIFEDEMLATPLVSNQAFGEFSGDIPTMAGDKTITYTVPNDTGVILFERDITSLNGTRLNFYAVGQSGNHAGTALIADRRSVSVDVLFRMYHASSNHGLVDIYAVDADASIDEVFPLRAGLPYATYSTNLSLTAGDHDIYVTALADKDTVLAGPFRLTVALGDVVDTILLDTANTATAEIRVIPDP